MISLLLVAALAVSSSFGGERICPIPDIPTSFGVHEKMFSFSTVFELEGADDKSLGSIREKMISATKTFEYLDSQGQKVAVGRKRFFAVGSTVEVYDCNGRLIGTIKEEILKSLFKTSTQYKILDPSGNEVASSDKVESNGTKFTLHNGNAEAFATIERPAFNWFTDSWSVRISEKSGVDPRILMMIPAFKTTADKDRKRRKEADESEKSKTTMRLGPGNLNSFVNGDDSVLSQGSPDRELMQQSQYVEKMYIQPGGKCDSSDSGVKETSAEMAM